MKKNKPSKHPIFFFMPWYWPAWLLISLLWLIAQLPYRVLFYCGKTLGWFISLFPSQAKRIARINIQLCFPKYTEKARQKLLKQSFTSLGVAFFETALAFFASNKKLRRLANFHGEPILKNAKKDERGILLIGMHLSSLLIAGRLMALDHDFAIVYRSPKLPFIRFLQEWLLPKYYQNAIERSNMRALVNALKAGKTVWYAPDIDGGYFSHEFIPFFGIPAATLTAPVRLLKLSGAGLMPCAYYRRNDGSGYDLVGFDVFDHFPTDDLKKDLQRINQAFESAIRLKPEQYIWQYQRFKTRPEGESRFYKK